MGNFVFTIMPNRSHLLFRNPSEGVIAYQPLIRAVFPEDDDEEEKDYTRMQEDFGRYRANVIRERDERHRARTLEVPEHIDYVRLHFFGPFDYEKFASHYRNRFGLVPVTFEKFNTIVLFAIINEERFSDFLSELQAFIVADEHDGELTYNVRVRYIREFYFLTLERMIRFEELFDTVLINLVGLEELHINMVISLETRLQQYLRDQNLTFSYNATNRTIQIWDIPWATLNSILVNFDIVHSVNSSLSGIIRPGPFATPIRDFGFTITPPVEGAPSIGIVDTGVSERTPLAPIILNTNTEYDLLGSGSRTDNHDGSGHGTGVAAFAALGRKLIPDHAGLKAADAWIVSIKIFQDQQPRVADNKILETIRQVHADRGTRIFVLAVLEQVHKKYDDAASAFAYSLDLLAHELDILIVISAGNVPSSYFFDPTTGAAIHAYPREFAEEYTNIRSPAESMNNLTVGACADNFEDDQNAGIAVDGTFPAIYTSKFHYQYHQGILSVRQRNLFLRKPDVLYNGGDWDTTGDPSVAGLKYISTRLGQFFSKNTGTSFSAGLVANLAARIVAQYPDLRIQSVKALIINSAQAPQLANFFNGLHKTTIGHVIGHGTPKSDDCLYSDDHSVTMVLEDEISPDQIKSFALRIPAYLLQKENRSTVLEVKMTLCFSFEPVLNNQMAYCPIHIGFGMFKNIPLSEQRSTADEDGVEIVEEIGINHNKTANIKIKSGQGWSEDYYFKMKLLSNTQKLKLVYNKEDIRGNNNTFKLAVHCLRHKLLNAGQRDHYNTSHRFSLVINVSEKPYDGEMSGNLYSELTAINTLPVIVQLEAEAEV